MKFRSIALAAAATVLLAGCGSSASNPSATGAAATPSALKGSITVWSWDVAATALKRLGTEYQKAHPGTTINVVDVGYDNAYDKIAVGLQAGSGLPDLITVETDHLPGYIEKFPGKFVDLTAALGSEAKNFDPSKIAAASGSDGKLYAVPWDAGTDALFVRTDYLAKAGVDPAKIATWADFTKAAQTVMAKTGKTALDSDLSTGSLFTQLLQQQGSGIFDAAGNIIINNDKAVAALKLLQDLNAKHLINNVKGWDARVSAAKSGASAFSPNAVWWTGTLKTEAPELSGKWIVQPLPAFSAGGARTSNNGGSNLVVPTQAKNGDLAVDFAKFALANVDNQNSMMTREGLFPSYLPALAAPLYAEKDPYFSNTAELKVFADLTSSIPPMYYTGDFAAASDIVANASVDAILNGKDVKTVLDAAAQAIAKQTGRKVA